MEPRTFPNPFATVPQATHEPDVVADPEVEVDHDRLMGLVDGLERDVSLIERAMAHVEMREFPSASAALDVLDGVASA